MNGTRARSLLTLVVFLACAAYVYAHRETFSGVTGLGGAAAVYLAILVSALFCLSGYTFTLLVRSIGVRLDWTETVGLSVLTNFGNYLGPTRPGAVLKAVYLKSQRQLEFSQFASVLAAQTLAGFWLTGSAGLLLLALNGLKGRPAPLLLVLVCMGILVGATLPFVMKLPEFSVTGRLTRLVQSAIEGFRIIRSQRRLLALISVAYAGQFVLSAWMFYVVFDALGLHIDVTGAFIIGVFTTLSNIVTITPNNLGIQEAISAYLFTLVGHDFESGLLGAAIIRALHLIITFGATPFFAHALFPKEGLRLRDALRSGEANST